MRNRVNPHLLKVGNISPDDQGEAVSISPRELASAHRLDLAYKHVYAHYVATRGAMDVDYPTAFYLRHLLPMTCGTMREEDGSKSCGSDYLCSFRHLINELSVTKTLDSERSLVPLGTSGSLPCLMDGAHRVAASIATRCSTVPAVQFKAKANAYTHHIFKDMDPEDRDRAAVEFCQICDHARILVLFPSVTIYGVNFEETVRLRLGHGLVHEKQFALSWAGQRALIAELYLNESWLGTPLNGFPGAEGKARPCFAAGRHATVFVYDSRLVDPEIKPRLRDSFRNRDSIHATDTATETLRIARTLLHNGSLISLNHPASMSPRLLWMLQSFTAPAGDLYCIAGSAVMGLYGIRDPNDLDVVHIGDLQENHHVNSHNETSKAYPMHKDFLIFDPRFYIWRMGIRFASLVVIKKIKTHINGPDDRDANSLVGLE